MWKMKISKVFEYYRGFRLSELKSEKYRHILLLLYLPIYGLFFLSLERIVPLIWPSVTYHEIYCTLDSYIPFCEWFIIPYYFWFVYMIGMGVYTFFCDIPAFRRFMWFIILSYSVTVVIYIVYPNMQGLRPEVFERDNFMVDIVRFLYGFDTNTNVCPSVHVLGSVSVLCAGLHSEKQKALWWRILLVVLAVLICASTVFLKQHSLIDLLAALAVTAVCYPLTLYITSDERRKRKQKDCRLA